MNVDIQEVAPCRKKISIALTGDEVSAAFEKSLRDLTANVQLPGYRRGHVPRKMLERKFSAEMREDVHQKLVTESFTKTVEDHKIQPLGDPKFELGDTKPEKGVAYAFTAEVDVRPVFELAEYKGLAIEEKTVPVTDADVDERLGLLRERFAEETPSDSPAAAGDVLRASVAFSVAGEEILKQNDQTIRIQGNAIFGIEVGDLAQALGGLKAGERKTLSFIVPDTYPREDLRGKPGAFDLEVKDVRNRVIPAQDEAFAQRVGMESMDKLIEQLRQSIETERRNAARGELESQLVDQLIAANRFDMPEGLVKSQAEHAYQSTRQRLGQMGASADYLNEQEASLRENSAKGAERSLRRLIIYQEIAAKEEVSVAPQDIQQHLSRLAMYYGTTMENMLKEIQQRNGIAALQSEILDMKVTQLLIDNATVTHVDAAPATESEG